MAGIIATVTVARPATGWPATVDLLDLLRLLLSSNAIFRTVIRTIRPQVTNRESVALGLSRGGCKPPDTSGVRSRRLWWRPSGRVKTRTLQVMPAPETLDFPYTALASRRGPPKDERRTSVVALSSSPLHVLSLAVCRHPSYFATRWSKHRHMDEIVLANDVSVQLVTVVACRYRCWGCGLR